MVASIYRGTRYEPSHHGLLNGRLLRQPPAPTSSPDGEYWGASAAGVEMRGGFYDNDELRTYSRLAKRGGQAVRDELGIDDDDEVNDFVNKHSQPQQGRLFSPKEGAGAGTRARAQAVDALHDQDERYMPTGSDGQAALGRTRETLTDSLAYSRMSDELLQALGGRTSFTNDLAARHRGDYMASTGDIRLRPNVSGDTVIHEMGHRADWRSHAAEGYNGSRRVDRPYSSTSTHLNANPRAEGIADGFVDRYTGRASEVGRQGYRGYEGWAPEDHAVYTAVRGHFAATGDNSVESSDRYNRYGEDSAALMHRLTSTSPHARAALEQAGPGMVAQADGMSRRYLGSRQVGHQLSMQFEGVPHQPVYDIPESHKPSAT